MDEKDIEVTIVADGQEIDTNPFVRRLTLGVIGGFVGELNGVDKEWKEIKIVIKR
ncbi:MAG: hypothetical protein SCAL_000641 [Candidatus Syntrophoarchaeum caldarius]|uniref:Uncharacterized protein n=1 Tax=Candidatus Syntropharchaeum caldarium TaxID=1838285 RepID=A0A1F2PBC7_9EURY|nr:MAG: hypothetical protein SCAL_000641 [Candidatus Syntrophoarchaeum caldarius]